MVSKSRPVRRTRFRIYLLLFALLAFGCGGGIGGLFEVVPKEELRVEIPAEGSEPQVQVAQQQQQEQQPASEAAPTETPAPLPTETPIPTPTPTITPTPFFLQSLSLGEPRNPIAPRHGLIIAFFLPLIFFGIPWIMFELFLIRYVQPRGLDITTVNIKAQDGLFVQAILSITARRTLTLASTRMTWPRVKNFVEKGMEQELIQEAVNYPSLDDLERNISVMTENLRQTDVVQELARDFGVQILRFNIEIRYTPETMDALQRKAEASAGGTAYLAYAAAAHLDPDLPESRELYRIYQETTSQVDAARNLGGGITQLAKMLTQRAEQNQEAKENDSDK